jgi:phosphoserine phosphatase
VQGVERAQCHVRCYSDHISDVPLLAIADEAFAVNAHPPLRMEAARRGWPLLDWR